MIRVPGPLKEEHEELHADLTKAIKSGGRTAEAAKAVAEALHPHFVKEEEYAMPPLGLLVELAQSRVDPAMLSVLTMTDRLEAELPTMLEEHKAVVAALMKLTEAAEAESKPEVARFAAKLILHAQTEEQVLYPAALLVGRFLKQTLGRT
jgi:hypothetical protein